MFCSSTIRLKLTWLIQNIIIYTGCVKSIVEDVYKSMHFGDNSWGVIELVQINPLPDTFIELLDHIKNIVVIEENSESGGLFSILAEAVSIRNKSINFSLISLSDQQIFEYGERGWLSKKFRCIASDHMNRRY